MVMLRIVFFEYLLSVVRGLVLEPASQTDGKCRYAGMREFEMIGPVVVALLGMRLGLHFEMHALDGVLHSGPERGSIRARHRNILGAAKRIEAVEIEIHRGLAERHNRMRRVIARSE